MYLYADNMLGCNIRMFTCYAVLWHMNTTLGVFIFYSFLVNYICPRLSEVVGTYVSVCVYSSEHLQ